MGVEEAGGHLAHLPHCNITTTAVVVVERCFALGFENSCRQKSGKFEKPGSSVVAKDCQRVCNIFNTHTTTILTSPLFAFPTDLWLRRYRFNPPLAVSNVLLATKCPLQSHYSDLTIRQPRTLAKILPAAVCVVKLPSPAVPLLVGFTSRYACNILLLFT